MHLDALFRDLKYAARGLRRKPAFTAAVVLTLGLGIGANATMFGVVDELLFRPPPYLADASHVHRVYLEIAERDGVRASSVMSFKRYLELSEASTTIDRAAGFADREMPIGIGDATRTVQVEGVSSSFFEMFDVRPAVGRFFSPDEDEPPEGTAVAVVGHGYWRSSMGASSTAVGSTLRIGTKLYSVIGIAPKGFRGMAAAEPAVFIPLTSMASDLFRDVGSSPTRTPPTYYGSHAIEWMEMLVRRKPGTSARLTAGDLSAAFARSREAQGASAADQASRARVIVGAVQRERGPGQGGSTRVAMWLTGVTGVVLLIACFNVGNLLLARAFGRRREIAIRVALGVGRMQLLRQLALESVLLAMLGALAGLAMAEVGGGVFRVLLVPASDDPTILGDSRVLLFTLAATLGVAVITGLAPALHAARADVPTALRTGVGTGTYHRSGARRMLLILQISLSVLLLVGAGLFVRSFRKVQALDLGYQPDRIAYIGLEMRGVSVEGEARSILRQQLIDRAEALPMVEAATRTISVPFRLNLAFPISVPGIDSAARLGDFLFNAGSPRYFETMGTRILRGRGISPDDSRDGPPVAVVSESMARKLWPGQDPIGKCVRRGSDTSPCSEVVGVVQDIKQRSLTNEGDLQYYVPIAQLPNGGGGLFVRTTQPVRAHIEVLRRELQQGMPGISYVTVTPLDQIVAPATRSWTIGATMFSAFGALALVLAAVGIYSVIAYAVTQRAQEIAVRSALGAQPSDVVRLIVWEGVRLAAVGITGGVTLALLASRWIEPLLFETSAVDPIVLLAVCLTLAAVAVSASGIPARRAARTDPNLALRAD